MAPNTVLSPEVLAGLSPVELIELILRQAQALQEALTTVTALRAQVATLEQRVAELEEQNRPPAAPFRRRSEDKSASPKRPGRPAGHPGAHRPVPPQADATITVPLAPDCPRCGHALQDSQPLEQWIEELPPVRPHVTHLTTWSAHCPQCQCEVRSSHPAQVSLAGGAAGVQLGARALAVACYLKHQAGLPLSKTTDVLQHLGGLRVSPGGLAQAFQRAARRLRADYDALAEGLRAAPVVHTDETSWWLGGQSASLWVFCDRQTTFYRVVKHRDRATFYEVIPADFPGVLVSDCLSVYDGATPVQQKCYSHHLQAFSQALAAGAPAGPGQFVPLCKHLLLQAMAAKAQNASLSAEQKAAPRRGLEVAAQALLEHPRGDPQEERVRVRLHKQIDHLFTFLDQAPVDATNNLAERQLRPAVIARKISCGQKTRTGADAWEVLASLGATCRQRTQNFIEFLTSRLNLSQGAK